MVDLNLKKKTDRNQRHGGEKNILCSVVFMLTNVGCHEVA